MSDFHKRKAEAKAGRKLIFTAESLAQWRNQEAERVRKEVTDQVKKSIDARIEIENAKLAEREEKLHADVDKALAMLKTREEMVERLEAERDHRESDRAMDAAFVLLMAVPLKILHEHYGWGRRKRIPEFAELICEYYQEFVESGRDPDQYMRDVAELTGSGIRLAEEDEDEM